MRRRRAYRTTYFDDDWLATQGLACDAQAAAVHRLIETGTWPDELVDRYYELTLRAGNRRALGERLRAYDHGTGEAQIATLKLPTLILWGGRDRLIAPEHAQRFARDIAGSQLQVVDALDHVPHEEDPAVTVVPVKAFLGQAS